MRGDGRRYKMLLRNEHGMRAGEYQKDFQTSSSGKWVEVNRGLAKQAIRYTVRGRTGAWVRRMCGCERFG